MIHHARKKENMDGEIYGIATDSTEWAFAHIDNKSRVFHPPTSPLPSRRPLPSNMLFSPNRISLILLSVVLDMVPTMAISWL